MTVYPDLDLSFRDPGAEPTAQHTIIGAGFAAEHVRLGEASGFEFRVGAASHYLAIHDIVLQDGEIAVEGMRADDVRDLRNAITFLPRGSQGAGWSVPVRRDNSFTALYFGPEMLGQELADRYAVSEPRPFLYRRDGRLQVSLGKIQDELASGAPDPLYIETLCMAAAIEVLGAVQPARGGEISPRQLKDVLDFVESGLRGSLTLSDLARVAGLSRFHFARAFKRATGQSPYSYVLAQRIARARQLLLVGDASVETVATAVGFRNGAQFSRAFRRSTGERPSDVRRRSSR